MQYHDIVLPTPTIRRNSTLRPVIVGFGPAGIFAALTLARAGLRPLVLERGYCVEKRRQEVEQFSQHRTLNSECNVQFGEGGAGTFSDGKLTTGIKDPLCRQVLQTLTDHGAPPEIMVLAKPHIGTDRLGDVIKSIRMEIEALGGEVHFGCKLTKVRNSHGTLSSVEWKIGELVRQIETDALLLCIGHSARDTIAHLLDAGMELQQKPFAVGARIEHMQCWIDQAQYGAFVGHPSLGPAEYKLACHPKNAYGVYTFCMCPGSTVVCAASEAGGVVVNGMSNHARDGAQANAALLVGIKPDLEGDDPLAGFRLQRNMEQAAYLAGGKDYTAPAQTVGDFLSNCTSKRFGCVQPSCTTGAIPSDIRRILPVTVTDSMAVALRMMDRKLHGFAHPEAVLTAPETRSSSPVRILRDASFQSNIRRIYPCGEGAGYAGGIVSAAVDGIRAAFAVLENAV